MATDVAKDEGETGEKEGDELVERVACTIVPLPFPEASIWPFSLRLLPPSSPTPPKVMDMAGNSE